MTDTQIDHKQLFIDETLVRKLVASQFPQWSSLSVCAVARQGWDNRTFQLGEHMLVRLPSDSDYALQVEKEQRWLPILAPLLPLSIPVPLGLGEPAYGYPWKWSIYRWLPGETADCAPVSNLCEFAVSPAQFLITLQRIDSTAGPSAGLHSFYRGGELKVYDKETRQAIAVLKNKIDVIAATDVWETALETSWQGAPVWVHGDVAVGNLLVQKGKLSAVIDFGQLAIGDPACDLAISWTFFKGKSRDVFRTILGLATDTLARARAWTLWKALITAARLIETNNTEDAQCWRIIDEVLDDHRCKI